MSSESKSINPFDDDTYQFFVLINAAGDYSLWPEFAKVPEAWQVVFGLAGRQQCLDYVETHWLNLHPAAAHRTSQEGQV